ncbi:hypothetical protein H6G04_01450 [Calothrix membranacea FACHB-236]|nr:hypothetical protein [Calothrix membranacea FACHB-236]
MTYHALIYINLDALTLDRAFILCADGNNDGYRVITSFIKVYYKKLRNIAERILLLEMFG